MDRVTVYINMKSYEEDILKTNKDAMIGLAKLTQAILGSTPKLNNLACTPTSPESLQVQIGAGEIYQLQNIDNSAYGSLPADTQHQIVKQGILLDPVLLTCNPPGTVGNAINYLIQFAYSDNDTDIENRPFYNSSNPSQPIFNNVATTRAGIIVINAKAGAAAPVGTQSTPSPDSGFVGGYVVTVQHGQTQILSSDIGIYSGAPFITERLTDKISQSTADSRYALAANVPANKSYFQGGNIANNATNPNTDIDFKISEIKDSTGAVIIALNSMLTKSISANWVAGNNNGGLFNGTVAVSTNYHLFLIMDSAGNVDAGFDTSITAANRPAAYTYYRRVASLYTDSSGNLVQIINNGDQYLLQDVVFNGVTNPGTSAQLYPLAVPSGIKVKGLATFSANVDSSQQYVHVLITDPDQNDTVPSQTNRTMQIKASASGQIYGEFSTDTSSNVRARFDFTNSNTVFEMVTRGWIDDRGRFD